MPDFTVAAIVVGEQLLVKETSLKIEGMFAGEDGQKVLSADLDEMWEEAVNPPFFGHKSIRVELSSIGKEEADKLAKLMAFASETCLVILCGKSITAAAKKVFKSIGNPVFRLFDYSGSPSTTDAITFVVKRVSANSGKIAREAASLLVSIAGKSYWSLAQEIDKIMSVCKDVNQTHVATLAFPVNSTQYYNLYTSLRDGDVASAILESEALVSSCGYEQVSQSIYKIMSVAVRFASTGFTGCRSVIPHRLTEGKWWPNGMKSGSPTPSSFMSDVAEAIVNRHGEKGVESILQFMYDDIATMRIHPATRHAVRIEAKILAICGKNGSPHITGGHCF